MTHAHHRLLAVLFAVAAFGGACGSGGGDDTSTNADASTTVAPIEDDVTDESDATEPTTTAPVSDAVEEPSGPDICELASDPVLLVAGDAPFTRELVDGTEDERYGFSPPVHYTGCGITTGDGETFSISLYDDVSRYEDLVANAEEEDDATRREQSDVGKRAHFVYNDFFVETDHGIVDVFGYLTAGDEVKVDIARAFIARLG